MITKKFDRIFIFQLNILTPTTKVHLFIDLSIC